VDRKTIGPYEITEELGSGGMGAVYKAYDSRLDRWVAIKTILPDKELTAQRQQRFLQEARSAARLNHAAISQVHDIISDGDSDHIVMEYVEGITLSERLLQGRMTIEEAVEVARQIAEGLDAAHENGIIHRDLKADNVMLTPSGQVKILDFGLAKRLEPRDDEVSLTQEGVVMGTCSAMSPEQTKGMKLDPRSDLFALGSLLYQMTTGKHPFATGVAIETMRHIAFSSPPPVHELNAEVPESLSVLISHLLAKERDERPQSAAEVVKALKAVKRLWSTDSVSHSSLGLIRPPTSRLQLRRRRLRLGAAGLVLLLLVVAPLVWWLTRPGPPTVVAVLAPVVGEGADPVRAPLAAEAVRVAVLNVVAATPGLEAPSLQEVDAIAGTPRQVAAAVAADEVLAVDIAGCKVACRVTLQRLDANGRVLWSGVIAEAPADDLLLLATAVHAKLRDAYDGLELGSDTASEVTSQDFEEFLRLRRLMDHPTAEVTRASLLERLEELRQRSPRLLEAQLAIAELCRSQYQITADKSYLERASSAVSATAQLAPADPRPLLLASDLARLRGDLEQAAAALDRLEELAPSSMGLLSRRARIAESRGDLERALKLLNRLVDLQPSWLNLFTLAEVELKSGHVGEARDHLEQGLAQAPGNRHLMAKLAQLELVDGDLERAEALYRELSEDHEHSVFLNNLGLAQLLEGKARAAAASFERSLALNPDHPVNLLNLADAYDLSGDEEAAAQWYERSLAAARVIEDQQAAWVLGVESQCLAHLGRSEEAVALAQATILAAPQDMDSYYSAAVVYTVIGEHRSAVVNARRAMELGMSPRWFTLGWFDVLDLDLGPELPAGET